ncbi:MAG: molybdopterin molybdotransferase MoeA [Flavobacteriales bacterium]|jgi:molybdopterin molybdotransferase|nr:molybdopterin molybdotransferase MoeA [Flavobacteriales bacterium]
MISVEQAKKTISNCCKVKPIITVDLLSAVGFVLSEDVIAKINIPSFDNSAMDGYAIQHQDIENGINQFYIVEEVKAGDQPKNRIKTGECVPIYTGAPTPLGADSIIMVEKTTIVNGKMMVEKGYKSKKGQHIRLLGEQIEKGKIALVKGSIIRPSTASYLSALGEVTVPIFSQPKVKIITTGNEIIKAGIPLEFGQIYESNSTALIALLKEQKVTNITTEIARDTTDNLLKKLQDINQYDIVILTGGISVGKYDLVEDCLTEIGVENKFYKVAQKPGKPLFFGIKENTLFFALPGNPAAVITSYYQYIYPTIRKMMGFEKTELEKVKLPLLQEILIKENRSVFLKGKRNGKGVNILSGQGSHILSSFSKADCFIYLPQGKTHWFKGENVEVQILPL